MMIIRIYIFLIKLNAIDLIKVFKTGLISYYVPKKKLYHQISLL